MGRWGWTVSVIASRIVSASKSINNLDFSWNPPIRSRISSYALEPRNYLLNFRSFSALPVSPRYVEDFEVNKHDFDGNQILEELLEDEEAGKLSVKAFFLCTRFIHCFIDLLWNMTSDHCKFQLFFLEKEVLVYMTLIFA